MKACKVEHWSSSSIEHGGMRTVFYMVEQFDSMGVRDHFPICRNFCVGIFFGIFHWIFCVTILWNFFVGFFVLLYFGIFVWDFLWQGVLNGSPCI